MFKRSDLKQDFRFHFPHILEVVCSFSIALAVFLGFGLNAPDAEAIAAADPQGIVVFSTGIPGPGPAISNIELIAYENFPDITTTSAVSTSVSGIMGVALPGLTRFGKPRVEVDSRNNAHVVFPELDSRAFAGFPARFPAKLHYYFLPQGASSGVGLQLPSPSTAPDNDAVMDIEVKDKTVYIAEASIRHSPILASDLTLFIYNRIQGLRTIKILDNDARWSLEGDLALTVDENDNVHIIVIDTLGTQVTHFEVVPTTGFWSQNPASGSLPPDITRILFSNGELSLTQDINGNGSLSLTYPCLSATTAPNVCLAHKDSLGQWQSELIQGTSLASITTVLNGVYGFTAEAAGVQTNLNFRLGVNGGRSLPQPLQPSTVYSTTDEITRINLATPSNLPFVSIVEEKFFPIASSPTIKVVAPGGYEYPISKKFLHYQLNDPAHFDMDLYN